MRKEEKVETYTRVDTRYFCESCDSDYWDEDFIYKCPICGKEICDACGRKTQLTGYKLVITSEGQYDCEYDEELSKILYVCKKCLPKVTQLKKYDKQRQQLIDKFNKDMFELGLSCLKGEL